MAVDMDMDKDKARDMGMLHSEGAPAQTCDYISMYGP